MLSLRVIFLCLLAYAAFPAAAKSRLLINTDNPSECVVLMHGLARSASSMNRLQRKLHKAGFSVLNIDYPSTKYVIETLVEKFIHPQIDSLRQQLNCNQVHFATHSMGGILLRYYLKHYELPELGRVVMISPPNKGSELVDKLGGLFVFKWLNGPAGRQLGTSSNSLPNSLGSVSYDVAVITGDRSLNPFYSYLIPGDDDGKVAVERARLDGMKAFKVLPKTHTFISRSRPAIKLVISYLKYGRF